MIAENAGSAVLQNSDVQVHAPEDEDAQTGTQVHEPADTAARGSMQADEREDVQQHATAPNGEPVQMNRPEPNADQARLEAENDGLRAQLENRDKQIDFLQEEIRSAREQRSSVVQISNCMLETLETMAIGGRLERPKPTEPVRYDPPEREVDDV